MSAVFLASAPTCVQIVAEKSCCVRVALACNCHACTGTLQSISLLPNASTGKWCSGCGVIVSRKDCTEVSKWFSGSDDAEFQNAAVRVRACLMLLTTVEFC